MIFSDGYYNAMDRSYESSAPRTGPAPAEEVPEFGLPPSSIGISAPPMQNQLQALQAKIRQGASVVELGFMGRGKGSMAQGSTTPEMYGMDERQDMKEIAEFNKIKLSTHATPSMGSLAGLSERGFDEASREATLHEIEKAIDFAADVTKGGAVVVHTGEYPRPIVEEYGKELFEAYPKEREQAVFHLVDKRTGSVTPIRKDLIVYEPVYEEHDRDHWKGIDDEPISKTETDPDKLFKRIPHFREGTTDFETRSVDWKEFERRSEEYNKAHPAEKKLTAAEMLYRSQIENRILQAKGSSLFYARYYEDARDMHKKATEALKFYERLEKDMPEEEKWRIMQERGYPGFAGRFIPSEHKLPSELLKDAIKDAEQNMRHIHEASASADVQAAQFREDVKNTVKIKEYAEEKTADTLARAAEFAMMKSRKTKEPIFVAPENIFPEQYGAHPQELKQIVINSREAFEETLKKKYHMSQQKARETAQQHIKATFDVGHANLWRKYYQGDPGKTPEENEKAFNKWLIGQVKELVDKKIIGHIHISDNFGWDDEHVTPGQGIAPIRDFVKELKKGGIKDVIVEPAHQDYRALLGGWREFGSSIYGLAAPSRTRWSDIEYSYFGRTAPPYFLYGEAAPDPEQWSLWTGQRLE